MEVGEELFLSWRTALHEMPWLALALAVSTRATPRLTEVARSPSTRKPRVASEEKTTVLPGATDREVADASFRLFPAGPKISTPTTLGSPWSVRGR